MIFQSVPGLADSSSSILEDRVHLGEDAALRFVFISSLDLLMEWERDGQSLSPDGRTSLGNVSYDIPGAKMFVSYMNLSDVTVTDHGAYRCLASFSDGTESVNLYLDAEIIVIRK